MHFKNDSAMMWVGVEKKAWNLSYIIHLIPLILDH